MLEPTVDVLAAIVREDPSLSGTLASLDPVVLCRRADDQGLLPLVAQRLASAVGAPGDLRRYAADESRRHVALDLVWEAALRPLLDALSGAGVAPLLMKGDALAYTHYERSDLRPRADTDLLIPSVARATAEHVLLSRGYDRAGQVNGSLLMYQAAFRKRLSGGASHLVDLHWRIANPHRFADVLSYDEAAARAIPMPALTPSARALAPVDALLVACVHRVAHHFNDERLIWLYDIHLLASRFGASEWQAFQTLANERGVWTIARDSLMRAAGHFHTEVPDIVIRQSDAGAAQANEATATFLDHDRRQVTTLVHDLRALNRWTDRGRLVLQHLFPSSAYMREVYAPASTAPLGVLYVRRVLRGARKWLARP